MRVAIESPSTPDVAELIVRHVADNYEVSPAESVHAMDVDALAHPAVTFWVARDEVTGELWGIGALKQHTQELGELKSMRTTAAARRRGVATALLATIISECRSRGVRELALETGIEDYFAPARALYRRFGFVDRAPFASYATDPNSVYLSLQIEDHRVQENV